MTLGGRLVHVHLLATSLGRCGEHEHEHEHDRHRSFATVGGGVLGVEPIKAIKPLLPAIN